MASPKTAAAALAAALALAGCAGAPQKAYTVEQPRTAPARNLTSMDLALSCLDRQLRDYHAPRKNITSTGIPSRAGDKVVLGSGVDMLKTSVGQLTLSDTYTYVDLSAMAAATMQGNSNEPSFRPLDPQSLNNWFVLLRQLKSSDGGIKFKYPDYDITGSISQADGGVASDRQSGGLFVGGGNVQGGPGFSVNQDVTIVTVDMQVIDAATLQMVNGLTTKNSIAVARSGTGVDLSGQVSTVGGHYSVNLDRSEGMHQAVRILIQLGAIELLGRLAGVPYEQCLSGETVQAGALGKAHDAFEDLDEAGRVRDAQTRLAALADPKSLARAPYYAGQASGQADAATRDAIARYQRDHGLVASGEVDLDLYRRLRHEQAAPPPAAPQLGLAPAPRLSLAPAPGVSFKPQSKLAVNLSADQDAHVQCFLQNDKQQVYRVFPSAEQPDDYLSAGQPLTVPDPAAKTQILLDAAGKEALGCVASAQPLQAGAGLPKGPLGTTRVPLSNLQEVYEQYRREAGGAPVGFETLAVEVR